LFPILYSYGRWQMSAKAAQKKERQEKILEAAIKAFSINGYHNSTVATIAREAGIADGTMYLYFKGKEELLISAFTFIMDNFLEKLEVKLAEAKNPLEKLKCIVTYHLTELSKDPDRARFLQLELRQPAESVRRGIAKPLSLYMRKIDSLVEEGKESGMVRKDLPTKVIRRVIFGAVDETISSWIRRKDAAPIGSEAEAVFEVLLGGMAAR